MRRALDPALASPVALSYLGDIVGAKDLANGKSSVLTGVKVIDPETVAITIEKPKAYWIDTLTYPTAYVISLPTGLHTDQPLSDTDVEQGIGSGPFKLLTYTKDVELDLTANADYWAGAPKIAGQRRPIVRDADTRRSMYLAGQLDLVDEQADETAKDSTDPALKDQLKFWPRAQTFYLGLNEKSFTPFADVRVRQALAYATDKQKIRAVALLNIDDVANDILPEGMPGFDSAFQGLPYDPAKAKALLAQAGYPDGKGFPPVTISYRESYPVLADTVDLIRQMWQTNLGITVQGKVTNWTVLLDQEDRGVLTCYLIRWAADYPDPQDYYSVLLRTGSIEDHVAYSNPRYDALCDQADICPDNKKRMALYRQAAAIIANEVPMIPLYYAKDVELVKPYVHNLDDGLMGHLPYLHLSLGG
jgi:ABC-type oligopeptide transport system substrate-binding subunit